MTRTHRALATATTLAFVACSDKPPEHPTTETTVSGEAETDVAADTADTSLSGLEVNNDTEVNIGRPLSEACGLSDVKLYFPFDSAEVQNEKSDDFEPLAECLTNGKLSGRALRVVGYADPRGTQEYNEDLGKSRAENIADMLKNAGIPENKLETKSEGESEASDDPNAWPRDRRVELYLVED